MTKRLILSYAAITIVVLILLEVPFGVFFAQRELDRLTTDVERDATVISNIYEDYLEADRAPDPEEAVAYAQRTGARVVVVDVRGISLIDTAQSTPRDFSTRPEIAAALSGERATGKRSSQTLDTDLLYVALPISSGQRIHGAIRITFDTSEVEESSRSFWLSLSVVAIVVLATVTLVGWLIARSVTRPLRRLNQAARRFGKGDLTIDESASKGPPEIRELSDSMATMAVQLATMIDQQRAFVADASHQLRTPLTGLRLRLENLQATLRDADAAEVDRAIEEIDRLSELVGELLQLARADRPEPPTTQDLSSIVTDRVDTWSAVADAAGIELVLQLEQPHLRVLAIPSAIEQILDNVLDNAIGIAPAKSSVTISVVAGRAEHHVSIADQGPGLTDSEKDLALRRFWRGDIKRPGTGLGLAIAEGLARRSGGSLTLVDAPSGGLQVNVTFPAVVEGKTSG